MIHLRAWQAPVKIFGYDLGGDYYLCEFVEEVSPLLWGEENLRFPTPLVFQS